MEEITTPGQNAHDPQERRCPSCGAAMLQGARFCGACGMESSPTQPGVAASVAEAPQVDGSAPVEPAASPPAPAGVVAAADAPAQPSASKPAHGADERVCPWCDVVNPLGAARCVACGAVFPTPEGDEALERAAIARIQSMESELRQQRRGGWWPFRSR